MSQRLLHISVGESFSSAVSTLETTWPRLVALLSDYVVSDETLSQFEALPKDAQLRLKDRGWWNGSRYSGSKRAADAIESLDVLCFDLDTCSPSTIPALLQFLDPVVGAGSSAYFIGSTRKHSAAAPRLRIGLPLTRPVSVDESEAIKRHLAHALGMAQCDPVTFRANQVMFWPSRCRDAVQFLASDVASDFLDPDAYLTAAYPGGWEDRSQWPLHPNESRTATAARSGKRADPRERDDLIGTWCRTFDVLDVMEQFIPGVYVPGDQPDRFTHHLGSTANGAAVYENGLHLYSHHQTDRATGILCNSWDLVRIHKFGSLDEVPGAPLPGSPTEKMPSQAAMRAWAIEVPEIRDQLAKEALGVFEDVPDAAPSNDRATDEHALFDSLARNKDGKVLATNANLLAILRRHPICAGLAMNANIAAPVWRERMPWHSPLLASQQVDPSEGLRFTDNDDLHLREWMVQKFKGMPVPQRAAVRDAVDLVADERAFHPIRDAFIALPAWDGTPRIDTMLGRYLGVPDDAYHRGVSRKFLCAIAARALTPGCKFDYMLVLVGAQGIGKSTFFRTLAMQPSWFNDNMPHIEKRADCVSAIRSNLIVEWAELETFSRSAVEEIKGFLTVQLDMQRLSYDRRTSNHKRQAVIVGTCNEDSFLKDQTGNRRFWPVYVATDAIDVAALELEREQLYAEARAVLERGERLYLDESLAATGALEAQERARVAHPVEETINAWLDGQIPSQRVPAGLTTGFDLTASQRNVVCVRQIALEALGQTESGAGYSGLSRVVTGVLRSRGDFERREFPLTLDGYGRSKVWERKVAKAAPRAGNVVPLNAGHKKPASAAFDDI